MHRTYRRVTFDIIIIYLVIFMVGTSSKLIPIDVRDACVRVHIHLAGGTLLNKNLSVTDNGIDLHEYDS